MIGEVRWIWRILGCIGLAICARIAIENADAYVRHRATGDQAGFALGMAFLYFLLAPGTAIALLLGLSPDPAGARSGLGAKLARGATAALLASGAAFFLWFQSLIRSLVAQDRQPDRSSAPHASMYGFALEWVTPIAFATLLLACAVAVLRPSSVRSPWFAATLVGVGIAGIVTVIALLGESPTAVILTLPTLALVVVAGGRLAAIRRVAGKERDAG